MEKQTEKYALVTGASSGIGYAYARELASRRYDIVAVSNEDEALRQKAETLRKDFGVEVESVVMALSKQSSQACGRVAS